VIAIIDYEMGNLRSVEKALHHLGFEAKITSEADEIRQADRILLPGVGAFGSAMERLHRERRDGVTLAGLIREAAEAGKPVLGICLGMQLLFDTSEERGAHSGLGLLAGRVVALDPAGDSSIKIPHMGWNELTVRTPGVLLEGVPGGSFAYFVHSLHVLPDDPAVTRAVTHHGHEICAVVEKGQIMGAQFHPEKSSSAGLRMLKNWARWMSSA